MPHTLNPFDRNHAISFEQLLKPLTDAMVGMTPLESGCNRPYREKVSIKRGRQLRIKIQNELRVSSLIADSSHDFKEQTNRYSYAKT